MKQLLKSLYAWRYRRWWQRWKHVRGSPKQPSPFFREEEAYRISKAIRDESP
jgi:hypothetical protein